MKDSSRKERRSRKTPLGVLIKKGLYNILYKLHILKHYHYVDVSRTFPSGWVQNFKQCKVDAYRLAVDVSFSLFEEHHISREWWHFHKDPFKGRRLDVNDSDRVMSVLCAEVKRAYVMWGTREFKFFPWQKTVTVSKIVPAGNAIKAEEVINLEKVFRIRAYHLSSTPPDELMEGELSCMIDILRGKIRDTLFELEEELFKRESHYEGSKV